MLPLLFAIRRSNIWPRRHFSKYFLSFPTFKHTFLKFAFFSYDSTAKRLFEIKRSNFVKRKWDCIIKNIFYRHSTVTHSFQNRKEIQICPLIIEIDIVLSFCFYVGDYVNLFLIVSQLTRLLCVCWPRWLIRSDDNLRSLIGGEARKRYFFF